MKWLFALSLFSEVLVYFCVGFTTLALVTYIDEGAIDVSQSLIVGSALGLLHVIRFAWDFYRDRLDESERLEILS